MLDISIGAIVSSTGCVPVAVSHETRIKAVTTDSRDVTPGSLFVCILGERSDGNDHAVMALRSGAVAVAMTREPDPAIIAEAEMRGASVLRAEDDDAEVFLLRLAGAWREANPQWLVVGITGSVGKTTTKEMVSAALEGQGMRVHATEGNHNNLLGVPLSILLASGEDEAVVLEMGMDHAGELSMLTRIVRPTVAVITNIGTSHIGNLGSRDAIAHAKAEIVAGIGEIGNGAPNVEPCLILCSDNEYAGMIEEEYCRPNGVPVVRVGREGDAVWAEDVTMGPDGYPRFEIRFADGESIPSRLPVPSRLAVSDFLLAMAVADRMSGDRLAASGCAMGMRQVGMRLDVIERDGLPVIIDDSYNASPISMASGLSALCALPCDGRRIAVLGEIGELGDDAARLHACVGAYAAACPVDMLVLVGGPLSDEMAESAKTMGFPADGILRVADADMACEMVPRIVAPQDAVLVKASRFVGLDRLVRHMLDGLEPTG